MQHHFIAWTAFLSASLLPAQDPETEKAFISHAAWRVEDGIGSLAPQSGLPDVGWDYDRPSNEWSFRASNEKELLPPPIELEAWIDDHLRSRGFQQAWLEYSETLQGWSTEDSKERIRMIRETLDALHWAFTRPVRYRFTLIEGDRFDWPADTSTIDDKTRQAWMSAGRVVFDREIERRHGVRAFAGSSRTRSFVRDYEVEVAQNTAIADPRVDIVVDGPRLCVLGHRTADDDLLVLDLDLIYGRTDPEITKRDLGAPVLGALEAPVLRETRVQTSFAIRRGHTVALSVTGPEEHGPSFVLLVKADLEPTDPARARTDIDVRSGRLFARPESPPNWLRLEGDWGEEVEEKPVWNDPTEEIASDLDLQHHGDLLLALNRSQAAKLEALYRSIRLVEDQSMVAEIRDRGAVTRLRIPVRAGTRVAVRRAWGTYELGDYEVEIAQGAAVANPSTSPTYDGLSLNARVGTGGERMNIELQGRVRALGTLLETQLAGAGLGKLFRFESAVFPFTIAQDMTWGEPVRVPLERDSRGEVNREASVEMRRGSR